MNQNSDNNDPHLYENEVYMHAFEHDLKYTTEIIQFVEAGSLQYSIQHKKEELPELLVDYDGTREMMEILSYKAHAKCLLNIPEDYVKNQIHKMTMNEFINYLVEIEIKQDNEIHLFDKDGVLWNLNEIHTTEDSSLLPVLMDMRYAASQSRFIY